MLHSDVLAHVPPPSGAMPYLATDELLTTRCGFRRARQVGERLLADERPQRNAGAMSTTLSRLDNLGLGATMQMLTLDAAKRLSYQRELGSPGGRLKEGFPWGVVDGCAGSDGLGASPCASRLQPSVAGRALPLGVGTPAASSEVAAVLLEPVARGFHILAMEACLFRRADAQRASTSLPSRTSM